MVEQYAYDAYGDPTILDGAGMVLTSSAENNRYTYTGREYDEALGLFHYRARMYDSASGRFCSRDPIGYEGSPWNLYEFVRSIPTVLIDPLGTEVIDPNEPFPGVPGVPPDYPRNPDGTPDIPPPTSHPDYPIVWPDDRGPGTPDSPPSNLPKEGDGDGGGCTCYYPTFFHRQRPKGEDGVYPPPGQSDVKCTIGATRVSVYAGSCSNGPCCSQKTCGEVTFWTCKEKRGRRNKGKTIWSGRSYKYGCQ